MKTPGAAARSVVSPRQLRVEHCRSDHSLSFIRGRPVRIWLASLLLVLACVAAPRFVAAQSNFVRIQLPAGVSLELPRNWTELTDSQRTTLDATVEARGLKDGPSTLPYAAKLFEGRDSIAMMNIRYYPDETLTQGEVRRVTSAEVREFDAGLQEISARTMGSRVAVWKGTSVRTVGGLTCLVTEYHRRGVTSSGLWRVRLVRVFSGPRSFTLTVSHLAARDFDLGAITDYIIASLRQRRREPSRARLHSGRGSRIL